MGWITTLRRKWLSGQAPPGGQRQLCRTSIHPGTWAVSHPQQLPGDDGEHFQPVCNDLKLGICQHIPSLGLLPRGTQPCWRKVKFSKDKCKVLPQEIRALGLGTGWGYAGSAEKGASMCFPQYIYNQEQIRNCILTVKSFSKHKTEKSLWRKKPQYAFTLVYFKPFKLHGYFTKVCVTDYLLFFCTRAYI